MLFSDGFRPFFLGAGVYALVVMGIWIAWLSMQMPGWAMFGSSPFAWHAHEMIFGFAAAALAGFLLTAVPNWTGALPLSGPPLMLLFAVWLLGRMAMLAAGLLGPVTVAVLDLAFLPLLGVSAARQLFVKPAARNVMLLAILAALAGANIAYHLVSSGIWPGQEFGGLRFALMVLVLMIAIIGGRVIPAFTHNWLHLNSASARMPQRLTWLDAAAVASVASVAMLQLIPAPQWVQGCIALFAALANAVRLFLWRGGPNLACSDRFRSTCRLRLGHRRLASDERCRIQLGLAKYSGRARLWGGSRRHHDHGHHDPRIAWAYGSSNHRAQGCGARLWPADARRVSASVWRGDRPRALP